MIPIAKARAQFAPAGVYLNSATAGLLPTAAFDAVTAALAAARAGTAQAADYDAPLEQARAGFAAVAGVAVDRVAVGSQASGFVGLVAAALPDGAEVVVPEGEFTSVTFPFAAQGRLTVTEAPLAELAGAIGPSTAAVAVAAVQSADGTIADLPAIAAACRANNTLSVIDGTQAYGWYPLPAGEFDVTVCSGYKWLLAPRGTAFMTVRPEVAERLIPLSANWYAGADRWSSIYGLPLRLSDDARRFDLSPVWHSWVGAAPAMDLLTEVGVPALHQHAVGLARRFCTGVGLPEGDSAIISVDLLPGGAEAVAAAGIVAAVRAGRLRLSFHLNNSEADVDAAVAALARFVAN